MSGYFSGSEDIKFLAIDTIRFSSVDSFSSLDAMGQKLDFTPSDPEKYPDRLDVEIEVSRGL